MPSRRALGRLSEPESRNDRGSAGSAAAMTTVICVAAVVLSLWAIFRSDSTTADPSTSRPLGTASVVVTPPVATVDPVVDGSTGDSTSSTAGNKASVIDSASAVTDPSISSSAPQSVTVEPATASDVPADGLPAVQAASWVVFDAASDRVLAAKNANEQRPIGSIQKLLTIQVALEDGPLDDPVTIPKMTVDPRESQIGLRRGEVFDRDVLVRAMLIVSANDAARALAIDIAGDEASFAERMNATAERLGMTNTVAKNAHGLDVSGQHSTANDVLTIARVVMANDDIREWVQRRQAKLHGKEYVASNPLFGVYRGADGVKTGTTTNAGYCFAASATRDGRQVFVVVLGSPTKESRLSDTVALLDWAFAQPSARVP